MLNNLGLGLVFTAKDLASGHIQRLERNFLSMEGSITGGSERIHASFKELGTGLTIFAAGAATLAGAYVFASAAGKFQEAIAAVGAVSNATASELQALHDAALEAGIQTQFTPTEATKGLQELAQAGFNAKESIRLLIPSLDLAAGSLGELTPEAAAGVAAQSMKAFGISVDGAGFAVDQMLQAVNVFALRAGELPLALGHAADGANALKQNLGETLIALGLIKNVIPGVERASTAAAVAMERLADPRVQKILHGIGVEVTQGKGEFRKFLDVIGDVAPKLAAMNDQQRAAFCCTRSGTTRSRGSARSSPRSRTAFAPRRERRLRARRRSVSARPVRPRGRRRRELPRQDARYVRGPEEAPSGVDRDAGDRARRADGRGVQADRDDDHYQA